MKRILLLLLALLLALPTAMAEQPLMEHYAAQLAQELPQLARNPNYAQIYGVWNDKQKTLLAQYAQHTWQHPAHDVYLSIDKAGIADFLAEQGIATEGFTAAYLDEFALSVISMQVQPMLTSSDALVVSSILANGIHYTDPAQEDGCLAFIRFFDDGAPLLYMLDAADGAVALSCMVLMEDVPQPALDVQITVYGDVGDFLTELIGENEVKIVWPAQEEMPQEEANLLLADCRNAEDVNSWMQAQETLGVIATDEPVLMAGAAALPQGANHAETAVLLAQATAQRMGDPAVQSEYGTNTEINQRLNTWAANDYSQPRLMVALPIKAETHASMVMGPSALMVLAQDEEGPAARQVKGMLPASLCSFLNAPSSVTELAASSMAAWGGMYPAPDQPDGIGMYFLFYEGGHVMAVSWLAENSVMIMQANYLAMPGLSECETATDVSLLLMSKGIPMACTEIPID